MLLLNIGVTYVITLSKKSKIPLQWQKLKKNFLKLRCSNVLLHLKYKVFVCEQKIKFKNLPGAKALATDHRVL